MRILTSACVALAGLLLTLAPRAADAQDHGAAPGHDPAAQHAGGHHLKSPAGGWSFAGPFGHFDRNQLQRGYKVYREVCAACHSMKLLSFRHLAQKGGPFYDAKYPDPTDNPYLKELIKDYQVDDVDQETGDPIKSPAKPKDRFPSPYPNEAYARAQNGGALPPDLSVIVNARHGGGDYVYSLITGYPETMPAGLTPSNGLHYNAYFAGDTSTNWTGDPRLKPSGGFLAMSPPLPRDGLVTFDDDTPSTREQMAADVAAFLTWAADPKMQTRKQMGVAVLGYLLLLALIAYLSYRQIWSKVEH